MKTQKHNSKHSWFLKKVFTVEQFGTQKISQYNRSTKGIRQRQSQVQKAGLETLQRTITMGMLATKGEDREHADYTLKEGEDN